MFVIITSIDTLAGYIITSQAGNITELLPSTSVYADLTRLTIHMCAYWQQHVI